MENLAHKVIDMEMARIEIRDKAIECLDMLMSIRKEEIPDAYVLTSLETARRALMQVFMRCDKKEKR